MRIDSLESVQKTIVREGVHKLWLGDPSGEKIDYFEGGSAGECANYLGAAVETQVGVFVVRGYPIEGRAVKGGQQDATGRRETFVWRMIGKGSMSPAPAPAASGAPGVPAMGADVMQLHVDKMRLEMELRWEREQSAFFQAMLQEEDEDEEEEAEEQPAQQAQPAKEADPWGGLADIIKLFREMPPEVPAPAAPTMNRATAPAEAVPAGNVPPGEAPTDEELAFLRAVRRAKGEHPKEVNEYVADVMQKWGDKNPN